MQTHPSRRAALGAMASAAVVASGGGALGAPAPRRLKIGLASRHLQFLSIGDAAAAAGDMGFDAIEWAVRPGGHIDPANVARDLPAAVEASRKAGLTIEMIITAIQDSGSPFADDILRTAQSLGIRYYRGSNYYRYDYARPLVPQIEALKPRLASLVPLNQRYGTVFCYHTHSGRGMIGGNVWDIWMAMRDLDPGSIGLNYDSAHVTIRGGNGWIDAARAARPQIRALGLKDFKWVRRPDGRYAAEFCPIGEGLVDFDAYFGFFRDTGFDGPVNIHYEHNDLLGEDFGKWRPTMPRARIVELMKADLDFVRGKMRAAQLA